MEHYYNIPPIFNCYAIFMNIEKKKEIIINNEKTFVIYQWYLPSGALSVHLLSR